MIDGPWNAEPDHLEFEYKKYQCVINRTTGLGALCGYVKLPKGNKYFGMLHEDIPLIVHGGITYGELTDDGYYEIGFDCAHFGDLIPNISSYFGKTNDEHYWTVEEVKSEIKVLVNQLEET